MDLCDIHVGEKYILNVNEYTEMDFDAADWMSRFADAHYGELLVVVERIDSVRECEVMLAKLYGFDIGDEVILRLDDFIKGALTARMSLGLDYEPKDELTATVLMFNVYAMNLDVCVAFTDSNKIPHKSWISGRCLNLKCTKFMDNEELDKLFEDM